MNIVEEFYRQRPLAVEREHLTVLVDRLLSIAEFEDKGGGGGPGGDTPSVRSDFRDTAFWDATVRTDANGEATVSVTLPDNLTTWRMAVQAVTAETEVGMGDVQIVSTLDVLIRPVAPRFLVVGDEPPGAIIHNNTERTWSSPRCSRPGRGRGGPRAGDHRRRGRAGGPRLAGGRGRVGAATLRYSVRAEGPDARR